MENIMKYDSILPKDFDGTFRFTNWTSEDFVAKWGGKEYRFPAGTTSPILIADQTPLEIQQIRKKFAKDLATREFGKSAEYGRLVAQERNSDGTPRLNSMQMAGTYDVNVLAPYIQKCLEPLPISRAEVSIAPKEELEDKLSRDESGELNTIAVPKNGDLIEEKKSLRKKALA